jgi:hypothetical protein
VAFVSQLIAHQNEPAEMRCTLLRSHPALFVGLALINFVLKFLIYYPNRLFFIF